MFQPTKFTPSPDRVLLQRIAEETSYHGIIVIPDKAVEKPQICKVISVSPTSIYVEGDYVLIGKYSGTDISIGDDKYLIIKEEDILGKCSET